MDGWVILDKDSGVSSRHAGARVARIFGEKKFGHIGTLDPMASGVLPIAIGRATKTIPFVENAHPETKEYLFDVVFGFSTDTLDITGEKNADGGRVPTIDEIRDVLPTFTGEISQIPPAFSAVHVNGVRAYDAARRGVMIDIPPRLVTVYLLECTGETNGTFHFRMRCSRGTYVRSIARDIAKHIGTIATVSMICRTESGPFTLDLAVKLDFLENLVNNGTAIDKYLLPSENWLWGMSVISLTCDKDIELFKNGGFVTISQEDKCCDDGGLYKVYAGCEFIGIGVFTDGFLRPKRII
ncbi:MAG: tRNA pseudouridine(55) synthase TruB [Alphaproteobacteria bacterium]|nr:tRNA pseudouridine(55) synthase TruB [Alphaproteobacteria bacterium]